MYANIAIQLDDQVAVNFKMDQQEPEYGSVIIHGDASPRSVM